MEFIFCIYYIQNFYVKQAWRNGEMPAFLNEIMVVM